MKKNKKGFTLVELLAVIVVLALIMIITIPAILNVVDGARRQAFYLYAQSVYQKGIDKYVHNMDNPNIASLNCATYDITKDLDLGNTGNYKGWIKVERIPASSGNYEYSIAVTVPATLPASADLQSVRYCLSEKGDCDPEKIPDNDTTYYSSYWELEDGKRSVTVRQTRPSYKYHLCVNYTYPENGVLKKPEHPLCTNTPTKIEGDTYDYKVTLSMKDKTRGVETILMEDDNKNENKTFQEKFYDYMEKYKRDHKDNISSMPLSIQNCEGNIVQINDSTSDEIQVATTTTLTTQQTAVSNVTSSESPTVIIDTTTTTTQTYNVSQVTTTDSVTSSVINPTTSVIDESLLLVNLSVSGYDIGFSPSQFTYRFTVPYNTAGVTVSCQANVAAGSSCEVQNTSLNVGENVIPVHVYNDAKGKEGYYYIYITRIGGGGGSNNTTQPSGGDPTWTPSSGLPDPKIPESNAKLDNIVISKYGLEEFSPDVFTYDIEIDKEDTKLYMTAIPQSSKALVTISGNDNLVDGSQIEITVISENGYYNNRYTITVHHKKKSKVGTTVARAAVVGLGAVLVVLVTIMRKQKKIGKLIDKATEGTETKKEDGYVAPTPVNQDNNTGNQ